MTKATMAGEIGDVEKFRADHQAEGLMAAAAPKAIEGASADRITDEADITSPGWDASAMPRRDWKEKKEEKEDTSAKLLEQAEDTQAKLLEQAEAYVVANPLRAIAAGLVAGVVLGRIL